MTMNFRKRSAAEPEINLIPFIDVLLVILIFLMLSTTYSRLTELKVNLPAADAEAARPQAQEIIVSVSSEGQYAVNRKRLEGRNVELLAGEMAAAAEGRRDARVIISADASAAHQSVIDVMDAARRAGLTQLTFATQAPSGSSRLN